MISHDIYLKGQKWPHCNTILFYQIFCGFFHLNPLYFCCTIFFVSVFKIQIPLKTLFALCIKYQQHHPLELLKNILYETLDSQISGVVCTYYIVLLASRKCITLKYFLIYRYISYTHDGCLNPKEVSGIIDLFLHWWNHSKYIVDSYDHLCKGDAQNSDISSI